MSYSKLIYFVLLPTFILVSCDTTSTNEEDHDLFEIISTEVDSIESNAIYIKTDFRLTEEYEFEETKISYELYISTEDQPDESNSVSFTDVTGKEGLLEYDEQENQGTLINVIQGLELETEYNYRIKIIINDQQKWAEVSNFRTKDVVEIISMEVRSLRPRSVRLQTFYKINETRKSPYTNYDLYISTHENPNNSNSVNFIDNTSLEGYYSFDHETGQGVIGKNIYGLLPSTKYYYRVKIKYDGHEQLSDIVSFTTEEESYEENGGIEFYDKGEYSDGWRYLVAAPPGWHDDSDEDPRATWGCYNQEVNTKEGIGDGLENTKKIIESGCGNDSNKPIAAELAYQLDLNGYSDWFLPSIDELEKLIRSTYQVALEGGAYWSSSSGMAFEMYGFWMSPLKDEKHKVRPVRRY